MVLIFALTKGQSWSV